MKFNTKKWIINQKTSLYLKSPLFTNKFKYVKASIIAILIGITLGIITVFAFGSNGFMYIYYVFESAFSTWGTRANMQFGITMNYVSTFIFMGLGLALGFKVGLFNMGGSGQAVFGFGSTWLMLRAIAQNQGIPITSLDSSIMVGVFFLFIACGVFISVLTGVLKVYFNIHEVASSIMFNWIVWFIIKSLVNDFQAGIVGQNWLAIGENTWILGIVMALVCVGVTWFILSYTTIGYKFNMVGKQKTTAHYAGVNSNFFIIGTTAIQGLFISLGGLFYFYNVERALWFQVDVIPTIGFDAIAVALVAFNNVLGVVPVAFFWGILQSGSLFAAGVVGISRDIVHIVTGIIIYSAVIYVLFIKFRPFLMLKKQTYINKDVELKFLINANNIKIKENKTLMNKAKKSEYIKNLKQTTAQKIDKLNSELNEAITIYKNKLNSEEYLKIMQKNKQKLIDLKKQSGHHKKQLQKEIHNFKIKQKQILKEEIFNLKNKTINENQNVKMLKRSKIIDCKINNKHIVQEFIDQKNDSFLQIDFDLHNAKHEASKTFFKQDMIMLQNKIKTEKQILKEEINIEIIKYTKAISSLKIENKDLTEKGFEKYYNSGLYGIKKFYNEKIRENLIDVLNQAVISQNQTMVEIKELKRAFKTKELKIDKKELKEQIKKMYEKLNLEYQQKVAELNLINTECKTLKKNNLLSAKQKISLYKKESKEQFVNKKTKEEKDNIKNLLFKKIAEVQNEYINT